MKVTVNFDCSPEEARQFLGLPDVRPFQEEMMKIMRDKAVEGMKMMEPETAMKNWLPLMNQGMAQGMNAGMDFFKSMMTNAAAGAVNTGATRKKNKD